jgi:phosphopantothenoylcysteine decarboxylase/phosphopantothenate--cysteine ligase
VQVLTLARTLSGLAEHICREDLVLVAPATLNTFSKIYAGFADNVPTTLVASALGMNKPVLYAPTMHDSLWQNPVLQQNLQTEIPYLRMIEPRVGEGKRKMPRIESIVAEVCREL